MMAAETQSNPFIRQLASSDKRTRDRALTSLRTYLHRKTPFTEIEVRKLWKGLFYCMWMSDKPRNQQQLARDLADLVNVLHHVNFTGFVDGFWKTIAAEWNNIDSLRMDKFLYLIRCYVNVGFAYVAKKKWNEKLLEQYLSILEEVPLNARDAKIPNGLRYHVIDVFVDELDKVDQDRSAPVDRILDELRRLRKETPTKPVRKRIDEALADTRLEDWTNTDQGADAKATDQEETEEQDDDFGGFGG